MTDKPKPGGLRNPPGGRPPLPEGERKVKVSITISQATREKVLRHRARPHEALSQVIERLLQSIPDALDQ